MTEMYSFVTEEHINRMCVSPGGHFWYSA